MRTEVICYAKKALEPGHLLDGPGGFASYGLIENSDSGLPAGFPIILSDGVKLRRAVSRDQRVTLDDIDISTVSPDALESWRRACKIGTQNV